MSLLVHHVLGDGPIIIIGHLNENCSSVVFHFHYINFMEKIFTNELNYVNLQQTVTSTVYLKKNSCAFY